MNGEFSAQEEAQFQAMVDNMHIGNDHAKVADARDLWNAGKAFAASVPVSSMQRVSILKDVNVRSSASTEARLPATKACPSQGLFTVKHGPLGTDGLPVSVQLESLGEWDIENLPDGTILYG